MKLYTKEELIEVIREVFERGWHESVKSTVDNRNDGAVGNTLETLLGIEENNLPIPNTQEWELKGQREHTSSLITLKHIEPSPQAAKIVPSILLPSYGWQHKQAGRKYAITERSFRSTTSAIAFTKRGFRIVVDRQAQQVRFEFDSTQADVSDQEISEWLESVAANGGLTGITPQPYWGFDDLKYKIGAKIQNSFYAIAESKIEQEHEYFLYKSLYVLSGFSFPRFLEAIDKGHVFVDFDARTGHNHGTKFRLKQNAWTSIFSKVIRAI